MGVIQNSFNQLLGIAAAGAITTGKALSEQHAKSLEIKHETDKLLKEKDVQGDFLDTAQKINDFEYDRRSKPYRALQRELDAKYKQVQDWKDRREILSEKLIRENEKTKFGVFGNSRADKKVDEMINESKADRKFYDNIYKQAKTGKIDTEKATEGTSWKRVGGKK